MNTILSTKLNVWELRNHPGVTRSQNTHITATAKAFSFANYMALVELVYQNLLRLVVSQNTDGLPSILLAELLGNSNLKICQKMSHKVSTRFPYAYIFSSTWSCQTHRCLLGIKLFITGHFSCEQRGKLAIGNLQSTLLASLAKLNVHIMCEDPVHRLIVQLEISIPEWELYRRIRVPINQYTVSVMDFDLSQDITYTLFSTIQVNVK
ncbi:unnamed protein product [Adineta ricciae]|uniref:Uncharacterized protein n=1 Tax=Adineta ricciae TaxID=249248 RepID=A0A814CS53_ADIRI|nr:unnamed protein product [Adineta ricciae]CAF1117244.1 unnamed protein product [Adineta ricciae]